MELVIAFPIFKMKSSTDLNVVDFNVGGITGKNYSREETKAAAINFQVYKKKLKTIEKTMKKDVDMKKN